MKEGKKKVAVSTVIFIPNTKGGILLTKLKEKEETLSELTGFRVKYAEAAGTPLLNMFPTDQQTPHCNRDNCPPCNGSEEERRQNCRTRNILYETSCIICNPSTRDHQHDPTKATQPDGSVADPSSSAVKPAGRVGIYIGESSRSLHERSFEHLRDARSLDSSSHIVKHWMEEHPALGNIPPFRFKIKKTFKDCLTRQVNEAISIMISEDKLLNGKCDYLNNCIARVTVDEDALEKKRREFREMEEEKENTKKLEQFRKEKSSNIGGVKRKRRDNITQDNKRKNLSGVSLLTDETKIQKGTKVAIPEEDQKAGSTRILALEYENFGLLALEYLKENPRVDLCMADPSNSVWGVRIKFKPGRFLLSLAGWTT